MKAIITGHTRGLGAALAANLLAREISVLALARGGNAELAQRFPGVLEQVQLDLSDSTALASWLDDNALRRYLAGSKAIVVINNAGMLAPVGPIASLDARAISRAVNLNVAAPLMLASAVSAAAADASELRIVHISSGAARSAYAGWGVYCATKAALDHHARAVALERKPLLRICSLAPGVIDTAMQAEIRASTPELFPMQAKFTALKHDGKLSAPHECADALIDYVLSEQFGSAPVADLRAL